MVSRREKKKKRWDFFLYKYLISSKTVDYVLQKSSVFKTRICIKWDCYMVCSDCSAENITFSCASGAVRGSWGFPGILSVVAQPTCNPYLSMKEADESCGILISPPHWASVGEADALWCGLCCGSWLVGKPSQWEQQEKCQVLEAVAIFIYHLTGKQKCRRAKDWQGKGIWIALWVVFSLFWLIPCSLVTFYVTDSFIAEEPHKNFAFTSGKIYIYEIISHAIFLSLLTCDLQALFCLSKHNTKKSIC